MYVYVVTHESGRVVINVIVIFLYKTNFIRAAQMAKKCL